MKIQCPKCLKNYNVNLSVEEMPEEGSKFSCQNCNSQFFVRKRQDNSLVSLMKNIKGKLDDWDNDIDDKALSKDKKSVGSELRLILCKGYGKVFKDVQSLDAEFKGWLKEYFDKELDY